MHLQHTGWWRGLRWSVVVATVVLTIGVGRMAVAQAPCCYQESLGTRPGIDLAVSRYYITVAIDGDIMADVYRFDSEANALASLEAIDAEQVGGILPDDAAIQIDALDPHTRAYTWVYDEMAEVDSATILTVDGSYLYIVSITAKAGADFDAVVLATTTIQEMIAAEAGAGPVEYDEFGSSSGGLWDKLPPGDGESPAGFWVRWDEQLYPEPEAAGDETDADAFDFSTLEGIQRAVTRTYSGDMSVLESPETAPATTYYVAALVAEFDSAEHAAASLETFYAAGQANYVEDLPVTMESVDPGDIGDRAVADFGTGEEDGLTVEMALVMVQEGPYLYTTVALGVGTDTGSMETATAVVEAMIGAEASSGDGEYDESGVFMTGGLWDKLPAEGDAVLNGLVPESDEQTYP